MNLVFMKNNQRQLSSGWEPFATSTPIKVAPTNIKTGKDSQKLLEICTDSADIIRKLQKGWSSPDNIVEEGANLKKYVAKKPRKNKSCTNFDFSSSDEDISNDKRRPIIKLSFKEQINSLQKNQKSLDKSLKASSNVKPTAYDNGDVICTEVNENDIIGRRQDHNHTVGDTKKKQGEIGHVVLENLSSDEENQIFDKVRNCDSSINNTIFCSERRESANKYLKSSENFKNMTNCKLQTNKSEKTIKYNLRTHSYTSCDSQIPKSFQKINYENKVMKRKVKNTEHAINKLKITRSKIAENKSVISSINKSRDNTVTPFHIWENKTNLSHQLFSVSKEQELINVLDLTSKEMSETKESKAISLWQNDNKFVFSSLSPHPSNQRSFFETSNEFDPRKKQNFKKYQLKKNLRNKQMPAADEVKQFKYEKNYKILKENDEHIQKSNLEENELSNGKVEKKRKKKLGSEIKKDKETSAFNSASDNITNIKLCDIDANNVKKALMSVEDITENQKLNKPLQPAEVEVITLPEKPVFKLMKELSYKEDETGCSAVECWDVNTFKCGVFKLKIKAQMNSRTLHKNTHLGGVLIKGNLKMKIGSRELDLHQGDMAFVPPLTEWQATNIGKCESVFYYWCGRFKI